MRCITRSNREHQLDICTLLQSTAGAYLYVRGVCVYLFSTCMVYRSEKHLIACGVPQKMVDEHLELFTGV